MVPVRWMAPETLQYGLFTTHSDVWAFGVLIWEMFSMGLKPYAGLLNRDIFQFLNDGCRMQSPADCPEDVYAIMVKCWSKTPSERPMFRQLFDMFNQVYKNVFCLKYKCHSVGENVIGCNETLTTVD